MAERKTKVRKAEEAKKSGKTSELKKKLASPIVTVVLFAVAAVMLLTSTIGGTRAAFSVRSENYIAYVALDHIGVSLWENGGLVSWRYYTTDPDKPEELSLVEEKGQLLKNMLNKNKQGEEEKLQLGKPYPEELTVRNIGGIDEYVRVTIYKYWLPAKIETQAEEGVDGKEEAKDTRKKMRELDPDLIKLELDNTGVWLKDEEASSKEGAYKERTVLYYTKLLKVKDDETGETGETAPFCTSLTIDPAIASQVKQTVTEENGYTTIKTIYAYDGVEFVIEVEVDAVQDHNAEDAILSAWGRRVKIENGSLILVDSNDVSGSPAQEE